MSKNTVKKSLIKSSAILPFALTSSLACAELSFIELPIVVDYNVSIGSMDVSDNGIVSLYDKNELITWSLATGTSVLGSYQSTGDYISETFISDDGAVVAFNSTYAPYSQQVTIFKNGQPLSVDTDTSFTIESISPDGNFVGVRTNEQTAKAGIYNLGDGVLDVFGPGSLVSFSGNSSKALAQKPNGFIDSVESIITSDGQEYSIDNDNNLWITDWHPGLLANGLAVIGESWDCASGVTLCVARLDLATDTVEEIDTSGLFMRPLAANSDGSVIVGRGENGALIWDDVNGVRDFKQMLLSKGLDVAEWTDFDYLEISNNGAHIVGTAINANGIKRPFIVTDVPVCTSGFK